MILAYAVFALLLSAFVANAATLVVTVDDPRLILGEWFQFKIATRNWIPCCCAFCGAPPELCGYQYLYNPTFDDTTSSYTYEVIRCASECLCGRQQPIDEDSSQIGLSFDIDDQDLDDEFANFHIIPGGSSTTVDIGCYFEEFGDGYTVRCEDAIIAWDETTDTTYTVQVTMNTTVP